MEKLQNIEIVWESSYIELLKCIQQYDFNFLEQ